MEQRLYEPQEPIHPSGPPPLLLWLAVVFLFLLIVATLAGLSYFSSGQRLAVFVPYVGITVIGLVVAILGGTLVFRRNLPKFFWLWMFIGLIIVLTAGSFAVALGYRTVLPPRYQEQFLTEVPFLRAFLPPTPEGGIVATSAATSAFSAEDLLAAPPLFATATEPSAAVIPPTEMVIIPTLPPTLETTATPDPTATEVAATSISIAPTSAATVAPQQVVERFTMPVSSRMYGFTHVQQGWNNCGPANITMALSYYGWRESQEFAANLLKPDDEDKNVSPNELVRFVNEQTAVRAITRIGGDLELLKAFIVNNIPVIVETSYAPEGFDWIGHYQTVVGYDDNAQSLYIYDSYLGTGIAGAGLSESYVSFDTGWQAFNRVFIAIYEPDREGIVQNILGDYADVRQSAQIALDTAVREARANPQSPFPWFNMGSSYTKLGMYEEAASAFDQATQRSLPFRIWWYQFSPFEAYFNTGRYDDVLALVNNNLANGGQYIEETYYWQGRVFAERGQTQEASTAFQRALTHNPRYQDAQTALNSLNT